MTNRVQEVQPIFDNWADKHGVQDTVDRFKSSLLTTGEIVELVDNYKASNNVRPTVFTLTIECDNAAFITGDGATDTTVIGDLLRGVSDNLVLGSSDGNGRIRDLNGNTVGSYTLREVTA